MLPQQYSTYRFQSTPPARGATSYVFAASNKTAAISIHAPREGGDRTDTQHQQLLRISIHAPREGGDLTIHFASSALSYFNPRPPRGGRRKQK